MRRICALFITTLILVLPVRAQVFINEFMASNSSFLMNPDLSEYTDWLELFNLGSYAVDLAGYTLSDDPDEPDKWSFPPETYMFPNQYFLVWADNHDTAQSWTGDHASFKLDAGGESIFLSDPEGNLIDSLSFGRQIDNMSYGRDALGQYSYFSHPTPGNANDNNSSFRIATGIRFSPEPGLYMGAQHVNLSCRYADALIRYTLDGSEPDENSELYQGELTLETSTVIRSKIWAEGYQSGWTETATYILNTQSDLPVFSLVTEPANLWDDWTGIYTDGLNGVTGYCSEEPKNFNQDWERPVSMEYMAGQGRRELQIDGGLKIHGGCSRGAPNKSFVFFARSCYGPNEIEYPFFKEKDLDWFKSLIFRNSGNDSWYTMIRDAAIQATVKGPMQCWGQAYEPVQLYVNGEFWGLYNLRERINEHYVASNFDVPADEVDLLKSSWGVMSGSREGFDELLDYIGTHDMTSAPVYDYVSSQIDIDAYIDYMITEMFFANRDWPGNNQKYWRHRAEGGKWRWVLYDTDFTMGLYEFDPSIDMFSFVTLEEGPDWPNPEWATFLPRKLIENQEYRDKFITRYIMRLNTTLQPQNVIGVIDSLYSRIAHIMPAHIERWQSPWSLEGWEGSVEEIREFARQRPAYVRENMRRFFDLGTVLPFVLAPDTAGTIIVNDFVVPETGMDGGFFSGYPVNIRSYPGPGYKFLNWEVTTVESGEEQVLPRQSVWYYWDEGWFPGEDWCQPDFNDSTWDSGMGELGYGDGSEATLLDFGPDPDNKYISSYFRKSFVIDEPVQYDNFRIRMMLDDGAVVYINGEEVLRVNMPEGPVAFETPSINYVGGDAENAYLDYITDPVELPAGKNTIAVEVHQSSGTSSDISFDLELSGIYYQTGETVYYEESNLYFELEQGMNIRAIYEAREELPSLRINEFMASNLDAFTDEYGDTVDWIEIINMGPEDVNIAGHFLTDDLKDPLKWQMPYYSPENTTMQAGGFIVLFADGNPQKGPLHLGFRLNAGGEEIGLSTYLGSVFHWIDTVRFPDQTRNLSYGRYPDGDSNWEKMNEYTPGYNNIKSTVHIADNEYSVLAVYPNPAGDFIRVRWTGQIGISADRFEIALFDLTGRTIMTDEFAVRESGEEITIGLSEVPSGIYILQVRNSKEQRSFRLIRE